MAETSTPDRQTGRKPRRVGIILALVIAAAIAITAAFFLLAKQRYDPPVIQGVRDLVEAYEDEDIQAALLDGVSAVGGEDRADAVFPVRVSVLDASGQEVQEYPPGEYRLVYRSDDGAGQEAEPVEGRLVVRRADTEGPAIQGARDLTVEAGGTISYREGVTATDNVDGAVPFQVDAEQVDLARPGEYAVTYLAADSRGNETALTVTVTVTEPVTAEPETEAETAENAAPASAAAPAAATRENLDELADRVLAQITTSGMTKRQKARAIFDYVYQKIRYVGTSDKSSWVTGAYVGLTQGRGDCFNYFALSKELLTRADIPNIDLQRVGGATDHYWQLVNVGDGWYHFDACPHPNGYPLTSFLLTEAQVRAYTVRCSSVRTNYYVYDYAACPVVVAGTPEETSEQPASEQTVPEEVSEQPAPEEGSEQTVPEETPEQTVPEEASEQPAPEALPEESVPPPPPDQPALVETAQDAGVPPEG